MCELFVLEIFLVKNGLQQLFKGVFMYVIFLEEVKGRIIIWLKRYCYWYFWAIWDFIWMGGVDVSEEILSFEFQEVYFVYVINRMYVIGIFFEFMQ